jgi:1-acyl-sn-glycerol-3-phosphate acyltransferase
VTSPWLRRPLTVAGVLVAAVLLLAALPVWVPVAVAVDAVRGRWRLPVLRLLAFALCWSWLEAAGIIVATVLWCIGQAGNLRAHFALQRWWARNLIAALRVTTGLRIDVEGADRARGGPFVALCRHASLADSLVSAWVFGSLAGLRPRYVLKKELSLDPCLDIVGRRLPNWFVDRGSTRVAREMEGIEQMARGLGPGEIAVIFPEGTRTSDAKRHRELARLATRHPERHARLAGLVRLLPPKPAGSAALLAAVPDADVLTVWHTGFDGLDTFGGILRALRRPVSARVVVEAHPRATVPAGEDFVRWIDGQWVRMDGVVDAGMSAMADDAGGA